MIHPVRTAGEFTFLFFDLGHQIHLLKTAEQGVICGIKVKSLQKKPVMFLDESQGKQYFSRVLLKFIEVGIQYHVTRYPQHDRLKKNIHLLDRSLLAFTVKPDHIHDHKWIRDLKITLLQPAPVIF